MKHMEPQEIQWNESLDELPCHEVVLFTLNIKDMYVESGILLPDRKQILANQYHIEVKDFIAWARIKPHVPAKT